jgi:hypothetical protein
MITVAYFAEVVRVEFGVAVLVSGGVPLIDAGSGVYGAETPLFPIVLEWSPGPMGVSAFGWADGELERPFAFVPEPLDVTRDGLVDIDDVLALLAELRGTENKR